MIDEDVPCEDILAQINAAKSALHGCGKDVYKRQACQMLDYVEYLADLLIAAELEQRVRIVEMLNKDGMIAGLEERLDRLKKEDGAYEKQNAA